MPRSFGTANQLGVRGLSREITEFPHKIMYQPKFFCGYDTILTKPGNSTYTTCHIVVPFFHRLIAAWMAVTDLDNVGAVTCNLMQTDDGDAKAGTSIDAFTDGDLAATSDVISILRFDGINAADQAVVSAGRVYFLSMTGNDAGGGDHLENPMLTILVATKIVRHI